MDAVAHSLLNAVRETSPAAIESWLIDWLPWILVAMIPGAFNLTVALGELEERCKFLPFFEPYKNPGVWLWAIVQFSFPVSLFWVTVYLPDRPPITLKLISWAIASGLGFVTLLNARTEIGARTYHFKSLYAYFVGIAYEIIADSQTRHAADFWTDVEDALAICPDLDEGLDFLENYFTSDVSLTVQEADSYRDRLAQARTKTSSDEQAKITKTLIKEVRRQDLAYVLRRFECSTSLIDKYFPSSLGQPRR
jgi:hypothetical protein